MKTKTQKVKTKAPSKAGPVRKRGLKKSSSPVPEKKSGRKTAKRPEGPSEENKKPGLKRKTLKGSSKTEGTLSPAPVAKKIKESSPAKPAKTGSKKTDTIRNAASKTAGKRSPGGPSSKSNAAKKKSPRKNNKRITGKKVISKDTVLKGKIKSLVPEPSPRGKTRKKVSYETDLEGEKSTFGRSMPKEYHNLSVRGLPSEYGENELIVMAVDPNVVFVDWEIRQEEIKESEEDLTMRVLDVSGGRSPRPGRDIFFDVKIEGRIGCGFFELIMPGRQIEIEIGFYVDGKFVAVLSSPEVSMPGLPASDELGILRKMFGSSSPVGY